MTCRKTTNSPEIRFNPRRDGNYLQLEYESGISCLIDYRISKAGGKVIRQSCLPINKGNSTITISLNHLPEGSYDLEIFDETLLEEWTFDKEAV